MGIRFTADEVLAMAEAIEANAVRFYERAAAAVGADDSRSLLRDLARWERMHERTFAQMRAGLVPGEEGSPVFDPDDEAAEYLRALADASVVKAGEDPMDRLGPHPEYGAILQTAVALENESIAFYARMQKMVPSDVGRARVESIIGEEREHLAILSEELSRL